MGEHRHAPALAFLEPDRPHNLGAALRLAACLGVELHVIEPTAFPLRDRRIQEAALDYGGVAPWFRHADLAAFEAMRRAAGRRLVLLTTRAALPHHEAVFHADDVLLLGNESRGAPEALHRTADLCVRVPMAAGRRSLNVVTAAAIALAEAMRQTSAFDCLESERQSAPDDEE